MIAFDARSAKALAAGNHLTFDSAPGLRLKGTASTRTWLYRYKSPVDDRMRQVRLGHWPAMSPTAALVAWQQAREARASGADIASRRRSDNSNERERFEQARKAKALGDYTVRRVADDYLSSYRGTVTDKTFSELVRLFARELGAVESVPASKLSRTEAFTLIDTMHDRPVVGKRVLGEAEVSALLHFSSVRNASSFCRSLPHGVRVEPAGAAGTRVGQPARLRAPL